MNRVTARREALTAILGIVKGWGFEAPSELFPNVLDRRAVEAEFADFIAELEDRLCTLRSGSVLGSRVQGSQPSHPPVPVHARSPAPALACREPAPPASALPHSLSPEPPHQARPPARQLALPLEGCERLPEKLWSKKARKARQAMRNRWQAKEGALTSRHVLNPKVETECHPSPPFEPGVFPYR